MEHIKPETPEMIRLTQTRSMSAVMRTRRVLVFVEGGTVVPVAALLPWTGVWGSMIEIWECGREGGGEGGAAIDAGSGRSFEMMMVGSSEPEPSSVSSSVFAPRIDRSSLSASASGFVGARLELGIGGGGDISASMPLMSSSSSKRESDLSESRGGFRPDQNKWSFSASRPSLMFKTGLEKLDLFGIDLPDGGTGARERGFKEGASCGLGLGLGLGRDGCVVGVDVVDDGHSGVFKGDGILEFAWAGREPVLRLREGSLEVAGSLVTRASF
jgi:hypothetical protein